MFYLFLTKGKAGTKHICSFSQPRACFTSWIYTCLLKTSSPHWRNSLGLRRFAHFPLTSRTTTKPTSYAKGSPPENGRATVPNGYWAPIAVSNHSSTFPAFSSSAWTAFTISVWNVRMRAATCVADGAVFSASFHSSVTTINLFP